MYLDIQDNEKVWQHFNHPHHVGAFVDETHVVQAKVGTPMVSNVIHWQMLLTKDAKCNRIIIEDVRYKVVGCGYQIAVCSYLGDCLVGRTLDDVPVKIAARLIDELALPEHKMHCAYLLEDAVFAAISNYKNNDPIELAGEDEMSVVTKTETEQVVLSATDTALDYIRKSAHDKGLASAMLHFGVKKRGCSGFSYVLDFTADPNVDGHVVHLADDVTVIIDHDSLPMLAGTQLDYRMESFGGVMKFNNPNEKASCGCGESFTVAEEGEVQ
jgi:iron-sulfur cluster assembly protein